MSTYAYVRVSTDDQFKNGESLGVQQRTIDGYAMMRGLTVDRTFVEGGVSGSVPLAERGQGNALLTVLKPGDTVICAKLDRAFRSALDALKILEDFKARGIGLHLIDLGGDVCSDGISKLVFTILSAVAEAERDRIRERIATVKQDQKSRGCYLGGIIPFGYTVVGEKRNRKLAELPDQQVVVKQIRVMRDEGKTLRAIRDVLPVKLSLDTIARCAEA